MLVSLVKALMPAFGQMWSECKRYGPGLQIEINKLNLDNQIMGNKASALKMYELIAAWQDPILTRCHYFPLASVLFHQYAGSCTSPPSLPSAITFQFQTGWTKQSYLSAQMVTLLMWDYEVQVAGTRGRGAGVMGTDWCTMSAHNMLMNGNSPFHMFRRINCGSG